ncbi:MAG TPA: hypothetical protein VFV03_04775, partial [Solirubrobacteraceae bacterium]|nr:hypothetical protein [Solirubrobacteraceae bacterium]
GRLRERRPRPRALQGAPIRPRHAPGCPPCPEDQALARELAAEAPTTPDTAALHAVADQLADVIANGDTDQAKALLRILIADLRINSRREILLTYRVGAPVVCAQTSSVDASGRRLNRRARVEALRQALATEAEHAASGPVCCGIQAQTHSCR